MISFTHTSAIRHVLRDVVNYTVLQMIVAPRYIVELSKLF